MSSPSSPRRSWTCTGRKGWSGSGSAALQTASSRSSSAWPTGAEPTEELTGVVRDLTGGNAFLVTELWRELVDEGAVAIGPSVARLVRPASELGTPATVREVANQRLQRLSAPAIELLELAAVAGSDFELATIRHAEVLEEAALLDAVDEAVRAGLLVERPGTGLAYRFTHELIRRAVVGRLSASRTAELHLRVARALEHGGVRPDRTAELAALAYHYAAAAPLGDVERAVDVNLLAAESALSGLAFDEAGRRFRTALELGLVDPAARADVLLRLGDARHRAGDAEEALGAFREAAVIARALGDDELLARAAIGFEETCWRPAIHDAGAVELLEEAADALPDGDSPLRARVLGGLARARTLGGDPDRGMEVREASIAMSRRLGDERSLAETLAAAFWSRGPRTNEQVYEMLLEVGRDRTRPGRPRARRERARLARPVRRRDLRPRRRARPARRGLCDRAGAQRAVPPPRDGALPLRSRALRRQPSLGRERGDAITRVGSAPDRA